MGAHRRWDAVLFDVGETLIGPAGSFGAAYARCFRELGIDAPAGTWDRVMRTVWREVAARHPPGADRYRLAGGEQPFWERLVGEVIARLDGRRLPAGLVEDATARLRAHFASPEAWIVYPDVVPVLDALSARGLPLGVVSNWDSRLVSLLEALALAPRFAVICGSYDLGVEKPDPRPFREATARLGTAPGRTLHVGDLPETDWAGGRAAGCTVRLVDRRGRLGPLWGALSDLASLPALVS